MSKFGEELIGSAREALAIARGKERPARAFSLAPLRTWRRSANGSACRKIGSPRNLVFPPRPCAIGNKADGNPMRRPAIFCVSSTMRPRRSSAPLCEPKRKRRKVLGSSGTVWPETMSILQPSDAKQIAEMISWVVAEGDTLEIVAGGTKRALGRPMKTDHVLDVSGLSEIIEYEPAELVLTAHPGAPLASINAELAEKRQMLAFEPPDWRGPSRH